MPRYEFVLTVTLAMASAFAQNPGNAEKNTRYLALGDSLAFGFNPFIPPPELSRFIGYPRIVSDTLHEKVANASCPGETSGTFAGDPKAPYLPGFDCAAMRDRGGLFVPYKEARSQLDYAVAYLSANPNPKLVTINIGGNDLGVLQAECIAEHPGNPYSIAVCEVGGLATVLNGVAHNLEIIYSGLRGTGYQGPIIAANYYAFNYNDPLQVGAFTLLNNVISTAGNPFGVTVADVFQAFQTASAGFGGYPCAAGLLLRLPDGTCDTHPTAAGQTLVAATVSQAAGNRKQGPN